MACICFFFLTANFAQMIVCPCYSTHRSPFGWEVVDGLRIDYTVMLQAGPWVAYYLFSCALNFLI